MFAECLYQWEKLAGVWELFEDNGLSPELLALDIDRLVPPVGIVGSGRGKTVRYLQEVLGAGAAIGFDTSPSMVATSRELGCSDIHCVDPGAPLPVDGTIGTLIIATGVLDPMERNEITDLLRQLAPAMRADAQLWIYAFGRFGSHWSVADSLAVTNELGISNRALFDLYALSKRHSFGAAIDHLSLQGVQRLQAKVWFHGIDRFVKRVSAAQQSANDTAFQYIRQAFPATLRRFQEQEINACLTAAGMKPVSRRQFNRAGVFLSCAQLP